MEKRKKMGSDLNIENTAKSMREKGKAVSAYRSRGERRLPVALSAGSF